MIKSPANLNSIEKFWRASNYLSASMLYLKDNILLERKLEPSHFKKNILGHWGTCPGINAIYAHVSDLIRRTNYPMTLILGTGHAGPSILSNLYLEGTLEKIYPKYKKGKKGMQELINDFASKDGFPTEISSKYPGMLYSGGELGSAIAFSQGYSFNNLNGFTVCVIGDGELETSITQASWQGFNFLSSEIDGKVLPIINANGYKMGSLSLYALKRKEEKESFFKGHGLYPIFVKENHKELAASLDKAFQLLLSKNKQPIIIFESIKGWTAPKAFNSIPFAGSYKSHKPVLKNPYCDAEEASFIEDWLKSYEPHKLFDSSGILFKSVLQCLPSSDMLLGKAHLNSSNIKKNIEINSFKNDTKNQYRSKENNVLAASRFLSSLLEKEDNVVIFSPDELTSNKFGDLLSSSKLKYCKDIDDYNSLDPRGKILEILNEHLCYIWSQGCSYNGSIPFIITYEAFAPIFNSLTFQHLKFLSESKKTPWRESTPSVNIILTSLGWRNVGTHQNPSYIDNFLGRNFEDVEVYMPVTPTSTEKCLRQMVSSKNKINMLVIDKYNLPKTSKFYESIDAQRNNSWKLIKTENSTPTFTVSIISIGDRMLEECLHALDIIKSSSSSFSVSIAAIEDIKIIRSVNHPEYNQFFSTVIEGSSLCIWVYNGYPSTIKAMLWNNNLFDGHEVFGYKNASEKEPGVDRFFENEVSRFHIAATALNAFLYEKEPYIANNLVNSFKEQNPIDQ